MGIWDDTNEKLAKHQEDMFCEDEPLEKARNQGSTPRPKGFHYSRNALKIPVTIAGQVRRGKIVGKGETAAERYRKCAVAKEEPKSRDWGFPADHPHRGTIHVTKLRDQHGVELEGPSTYRTVGSITPASGSGFRAYVTDREYKPGVPQLIPFSMVHRFEPDAKKAEAGAAKAEGDRAPDAQRAAFAGHLASSPFAGTHENVGRRVFRPGQEHQALAYEMVGGSRADQGVHSTTHGTGPEAFTLASTWRKKGVRAPKPAAPHAGPDAAKAEPPDFPADRAAVRIERKISAKKPASSVDMEWVKRNRPVIAPLSTSVSPKKPRV